MKRLLPVAAVSAALLLTATATSVSAAPAQVAEGDSARAHGISGQNEGHGTRGKHRENSRTKMPSPLVVAHRGASGYRPEHTVGAYELAVQMGADYIEPDLVMTKDGVLVDRHEPEISGTTDVASRPEFAQRKTTKSLDGVKTTGWFTEDFTLAELKTLRAKERLPEVRQQNTIYDGMDDVPTFEEVLKLRESLSKKYGRTIGVIPEIKHSAYFHEAGFDPEKPFVTLAKKYHLNKPSSPMWLQSFEISNLRYVRTLGYKANSTFLASATGGPYDLVAKKDSRDYAYWMSPKGLDELSTFADGIGPVKELVIPKKADGSLGEPTSLVKDAHARDLEVIPWTFRNENQFMATDFRRGTNPADYGDAVEEMVVYLRTGIDGVFTDNPDTGVVARKEFWAEQGR
ncbi:glycerophosphodiester phosphodiesterase [Mobilicoccus caccae]|uniref:glycerophosphodiester phosphodiesterase n=1 Tax=Mobilicoccus caccae TaxID=1859295 RepID=A0ABQ6IQ26_9MICO|nr:glycerophosphodiester phosphodiesterase [Mobilicoccus caccae]GMA39358.1 glycerophosphoryl diester phosphodiesterase [Mobilicoccus caccae]